MRVFSFRWNIHAISSGRISDPDWNTIHRNLIELRKEAGFAELSIINAADVGPQNIQLWSDGFNYLGLLSELTVDDHEVRTFTRPDADHRHMIEIAGYEWDACSVVRNFENVENAFREFFDIGNVSRNLMS